MGNATKENQNDSFKIPKSQRRREMGQESQYQEFINEVDSDLPEEVIITVAESIWQIQR